MSTTEELTTAPLTSAAEAEVVELCRSLIRFDTSNPTSNERAAAEWTAEQLTEAGLTPQLLESEPGRASVVARWEGTDSSRPALLIHGHLDVVPADADDWQLPPFSGEIADDCVWGRGAVDMKDMDAMTLAVVRDWAREGRRPPRDVVLAFVADEEAGGRKGAHWLVDNHPDLFEGCTEAISEVGGFSVTVEGQRLYLLQTAEKGIDWLHLVARGRAGHGSMLTDDNAVAKLAEAVARVGSHRFPVTITPAVEDFLRAICDVLQIEFDPADAESVVERIGPMARMLGATLRHTANPTMLDAGYKHNVIPQVARAAIDCRYLPGLRDDFRAQLAELVGDDIEIETAIADIDYSTSFDGPLVDAMTGAVVAEDPDGRVIPYCVSGGTDAKSFSTMGMRCFGFSPLQLPDGLDFTGMFHGIDERVPTDSLQWGSRVLSRFLATC